MAWTRRPSRRPPSTIEPSPSLEAIITEVPVFFSLYILFKIIHFVVALARCMPNPARLPGRDTPRLVSRYTFCLKLYILIFALSSCMPNPARPPRCLPVSFLFVSRYTFCFKLYILFFHWPGACHSVGGGGGHGKCHDGGACARRRVLGKDPMATPRKRRIGGTWDIQVG